MPTCKKCETQEVSKNGFLRCKQRYLCKTCGYNFVCGDERSNPKTAVKRAFAVILYSLGKASYRFIAKLFNVSPSTVQKWIASEAAPLEMPEIPDALREIEFDEMWHFIGHKQTNAGFSKPFLVRACELSPGLLGVVTLKHSQGSTRKSNP